MDARLCRIDARIISGCAKLGNDVGSVVGELVAEESAGRAQLRSDLHDLKIEVARLTSIVATQREELATARAAACGDVLPPLPSERVN